MQNKSFNLFGGNREAINDLDNNKFMSISEKIDYIAKESKPESFNTGYCFYMSINESKISDLWFFLYKYSSTIKDLIQSISLCSSFNICLYLLDNEMSSDISDEILEMMGELTIEEKKTT